MKNATLIYWAKDENTAKNKNVSGTVRSMVVAQADAVKVAKELNGGKHGAAAGHGVTIKYASGRLREIR